MAGDHKTKTLQELPPLNELKDSDILITSDGSTTYKVNGYDFIQYVRKHSDISGFFVHQDAVGRPDGIAPLDAASKLFSNNIPFGSSAGSVFDGASGKALSDTLTSHRADKGNPHRVTKAQVGLGNANDTSDLDKPVSTAQQAAIRKACEDAGKYTDTAMSRVVDGAPKDMDTLHKAAKALEEQKKAAETLSSLIGNKVDKAAGKKLSTNDYTNEEKAKLLSIENGANHYVHPDTDGCKHIPANGTANDGSYLKSTSKPGIYAWGKLTNEDVTAALGYTPSGSGGVTYALSKSGSNIILTGSDGSETSIPDADTTYTLSDFGIAAAPAEINQVKGASSNLQAQLDNTYTKKEADALLNDKLSKTGDAGNTTVTYVDAEALTALSSGEKQSIAYGKLKQAVNTVISLTRLLGATDISSIGGGTVTGALSALQNNMTANKLNIPATYTAFTITDIISDAIITLKTDEDHVAGFYCRFKAVQPLAANVNYRIASFYGGLPDQANMVVPIVILTPATVPCGTGMLIFGAGVLYMISNIDIPSGYIIQGSASYVM